MNKIIKNIILVCVLTCLYSIGFSQHHHTHDCTLFIPSPPQNKTQPDGEQITIKAFDNTRSSYIETMDGYTIKKDKQDDFYKYVIADTDGDLLLTNIIARNADNRSQKERNFLSQTPKKLRVTGKALKDKQALQKSLNQSEANLLPGYFPSSGVNKALVLLIEFDPEDEKHTYTVNDFDRLFNEPGYAVNGQTGSFRDYYRDISYGDLTVNSEVRGWYTAPEEKAYYGADLVDANGNIIKKDVNEKELVIEAINAADPDVDFSEYDNDGDDIVDLVMIIHAGSGYGIDGIEPNLGFLENLKIDGVEIRQYTIQAETYEKPGELNINNIGIICHEFGHALGIYDLYGSNGDPGINVWGVMGGGALNNDGRTPAHMCAWSKIQLGWIDPTVITSPESISNMPTIDKSPTCYRLNTTTSTEYFLISARQQSGWDSGLSQQGVAIWHIDDTQPGNYKSTERPQVELEGIYGTTNKTTFNANTNPDSKTYEGYDSGNCVSNISVSGTASNLKASYDIDCAYAGAQYCLPENVENINSDFFYISNVTFADINNSSSYSGYTNYIYDDPAIVSISSTHLLSVSRPNDAVFNTKCFWKVWIDYNQDGIFDDNSELVLNRVNEANSLITENVIIPANALPGTTRMRVAMKYSESGVTAPLPCEEGEYGLGELEDYAIIICSTDADNDGVCAENDCDDNDPNIPAEFGISCDDGNPNTTEDRIQIDGCTCAGFYECVPFHELSGTINSGIFPVQDYIHADGQISAGSTVNFVAGNHVDLLPGFDAKGNTGTDLLAFIKEVCPANKQETDEEQIAIRNYPNPFTGQTTIEFELSKDTPVTLLVSDAMGREVEVLLDNKVTAAGTHLTTFDGSNYPTGMYYYTIQAGAYTSTQKMILIK